MLFTEKTKAKLGYLGTVEGHGMYENARIDPKPFIELYQNSTPNTKKEIDLRREFFKVRDDITSYYFFARRDGVDIFVEVPLVEDDDIFKWKRRDWGSFKTLWSQIERGYLTFSCAYYLNSKDVRITVRWSKERFSNVIGNMWIENGTNEEILTAIKSWEREFYFEVCRAVESDIKIA